MTAGDFKRWLYRGDKPHLLARILNRLWAKVHSWGVAPDYFVTLEVEGRRTGRVTSLPLVMVVVDGHRYLVSMLGENVSWVRNVRACGGRAVLQHGRREPIELREIAVEERPPILKAYLKKAPGARPHIAVDQDAPLAEFVKIAATLPVFRVLSRS